MEVEAPHPDLQRERVEEEDEKFVLEVSTESQLSEVEKDTNPGHRSERAGKRGREEVLNPVGVRKARSDPRKRTGLTFLVCDALQVLAGNQWDRGDREDEKLWLPEEFRMNHRASSPETCNSV